MKGVRVLELAPSLASAYCGRLFATVGADVVVAEPPGGVALRLAPPLLATADGTTRSALWEHLGAGKRSVVLADGDDPPGGPLDQLLRWADLVVTSTDGQPEDAVALAERVGTVNPAAVVTVCSGFGLTGPYRHWRSSALGDWAASGHLYLTGEPDREPVQGGGPWDSYLTGTTAAIGSAAAVMHAARTGEGQVVDVGAMEAGAALHQWTVAMYTHLGAVKRRWGNLLGEATHPIALYRCADGYVSIVAVTQPQWEALCLAMELYDLLVDPALEVIGMRFDRAAEIDAQIDAWLADRTVDEAVEHLQSRGVPASRLLTMAQVAREPQLDLRHFFATPPGWGDDARLPWVPFRLEGEAPEYSPAPAVGADTRAVLAGLASERAPLPAVDLASVRILEFGVAWAGPLAGRWLGDLGADVVKVEHPASRGAKPDRSFAEGWQWGTLPHPRVRYGVFPDGDPGERWWNRGGMFNKMNRSKRGVAVDAKTPAGERVLRGLIAASDVVLNNYSPRGAASLRIDAKGVRADNARAITVSMSGYGADGPLAGNLSYGPVLQAHGGFDEATGYLGGPPQRIGVAYPDAVGGVHGAFAILAALWERARTDRPIDVDLSQLETLLSIAGEMLLAASVTGQGPVRHGNRAEGIAPQGVYPCAGDDEWVAVSVDRDEAWRALVDTIGDAALAPWRAASLAERTAAQDTLDERLAAWTRQRSARAVAGPLQAAGVVAVPVMTNQDLVEDEHLVERGFLVVLDQPDVGPKAFAGGGLHLSRTPLRLLHGPGLGEHNRAVLSEYLGTGEPELQELYATGVIADRPPAP